MPAGSCHRASRLAVWLAAIVVAGAVAAVIAIRDCDRSDTPTARPASGSPAGGPGSDSPRPVAEPGPNAPGPQDAHMAGSASDATPALVESARSEAAARHYAQALALYRRAYELAPHPATLLEIGRMLHLIGRCREARRTTQRVVASSPEPAIADDARQLLERIGRCD